MIKGGTVQTILILILQDGQKRGIRKAAWLVPRYEIVNDGQLGRSSSPPEIRFHVT